MTLSAVVYLYLGGSWTDVTGDVFAPSGIQANVGMRSNKETDRVARHGELYLTFLNNDESYTPGSGTAHADWGKSTPIKVEINSTVKFIGRVNTIKLKYEYNDYKVEVTALDWMYYAAQLPLDIPPLLTDKRADQVITEIVSLSPIQPTATSYQTGNDTFPYAFHDNTVKTTAYTEITKAVMSEWGYAYVKLDGTLVFEAYNGRETTQKSITYVPDDTGFLLKSDGDYLLLSTGDKIVLTFRTTENVDADTLKSISLNYGENIANRVSAQVYPYKSSTTDQLVYTAETNQIIPAGETISFRVQFTDENSRQPIAAEAPVVKQYTLLHFDSPGDGISGVVDSAEPKIAGDTTAFDLGSGAAWYTSPKKFGTACIGFNGSSDYVYGTSQEKFNFRAGDFTVDWWEYRLDAASGKAAISRSTTAAYAPYVFGYSDGSTARCYITSNGSSWDIANARSMGSISTGTWVHYAITRSGSTFRTFKNGTQQDTWTSSATVYPSTDAFSVARYNGGYYNGYIDELRLIKGYAAWTANFTPPVKQHEISGVNWSAYTAAAKTGTDISNDISLTIGAGGVGLDITATSSSGSDGYLNLDIYAPPLQSLSPISYIKEDATSVGEYGYFGENVDMRLRDDIVFAQTVADALVAAEKDPRIVLNSISVVANKSPANEAMFLQCDIGDLVRVTDSLSGYSELNHIQGISWSAIPGDGGSIVYFDWILKEQ